MTKRTWKYVFLCLALFVNTSNAQPSAQPNLLYQQISTNQINLSYLTTLRNQGKLEEAKAQAIRYLQMYPDDADVKLFLANIYFSQSNYRAAYTQANQAIELTPKYTEVRILLIKIYLALNNKVAALREINNGLKYAPDNYSLLEMKKSILTNKQVSLQEPDSVGARLNKLLQEQKLAEAKEGALKQLKANPNDTDTMLVLAHVYYREKNYDEAGVLIQRILRVTPNYDEARIIFVRILLETHQKDAALAQIETGLKYNPNSKGLHDLRNNITNVQTTSEKQQDALPTPNLLMPSQDYIPSIQSASQTRIQQQLAQQQKQVLSPSQSIQQTAQQKVVPSASAKPEKSTVALPAQDKPAVPEDKQPAKPTITYQELITLKNKGQTTKAKTEAITYLEQYPDDGDIQLFLAQLYFEERNYGQAQALAQKALQKTPTYVDVRLLLIRLNLATGNQKAAMQLLDEGLKTNPSSNELQKMKQVILAADKQPPRKSPEISVNYQSLIALKKAGETQLAKEKAIAYLQKNPTDGDIQLFLGQIYFEEKNYPMARELATKALTASPRYEDVRILLIKVNLAQKKTMVALRLIAEGLKYAPNSPELQKIKKLALGQYSEIEYQTIQTKIESDQIQAAWFLAVEYLSKYPNDDDVRYQLGKIYEKEKNVCFAKGVYNDLLAKNPLNMDARLALINLLKNDDCEAALDLIQEGFWYYPDDSRLISRRAELYAIEKLFYHGMVVAKHALCIDPHNKHAVGLINEIKDASLQYNTGVNEFGFYVLPNYVKDLDAWWNESSLFYIRHSRYGDVVVQANNAYRFGRWATQLELNVNPVLNKYVYFHFEYAYADNPFLFPKYRLGGEVFVSIPSFVDISLGGRHWHIADPYFNVFTASIGKETKNYWLLYRPYVFVPKRGSGTGQKVLAFTPPPAENSTLHTFKIRKFFDDPDTWLDVTTGFGHSPDLNDLQNANFIVINNKFVVLSAQIPICKHTLDLGLFADYQRQVYPTRLLREIMGAGFGIKWRF